MSTTTIRLTDELKARVARAAADAGPTAHSFILEAIALYRYSSALDTIFVLAIRSQREGGYSRSPGAASADRRSLGQASDGCANGGNQGQLSRDPTCAQAPRGPKNPPPEPR